MDAPGNRPRGDGNLGRASVAAVGPTALLGRRGEYGHLCPQPAPHGADHGLGRHEPLRLRAGRGAGRGPWAGTPRAHVARLRGCGLHGDPGADDLRRAVALRAGGHSLGGRAGLLDAPSFWPPLSLVAAAAADGRQPGLSAVLAELPVLFAGPDVLAGGHGLLGAGRGAAGEAV